MLGRRGLHRSNSLPSLAFLGVLGAVFLFPFVWMVLSAFKDAVSVFNVRQFLPATWRWKNFADVFTHQPYGRHYLNSLYISSLVTVGTLFVSSLSGYAFARIHFPGRSAVFLIVLAGLMIPVEVSIIPNFFLMKTWRFIDTHWPLILLPIFGARSVMSTFMMRQFYLGIPAEIEEAARIDGLDRFGIYARIVMPLAAPAMASVAILTFLNSWNEFLEPLVFLSDLALFTLPLSLNNFTDVGGLPMWNLQLAATTLSVLPILLVYIAAQQRITDSMVLSGVKG